VNQTKASLIRILQNAYSGGPEEDTSGGVTYGGWQAAYSDDVIGTVMNRQMSMPFDLLLGRKTFDIWSPFWPQLADEWRSVMTATKYVASNTMTSQEWRGWSPSTTDA